MCNYSRLSVFRVSQQIDSVSADYFTQQRKLVTVLKTHSNELGQDSISDQCLLNVFNVMDCRKKFLKGPLLLALPSAMTSRRPNEQRAFAVRLARFVLLINGRKQSTLLVGLNFEVMSERKEMEIALD